MKIGAFLIALFIFFAGGPSFCAEESLTLNGIVAMTQQGVSEDEMVWRLRNSGSEFNLTDADETMLRSRSVMPWAIMVMKMSPAERLEKVPRSQGEKYSMRDIINISKKGTPPHEIAMVIVSTGSKYNLSAEEKAWLSSEGVNPLAINIMSLYPEANPPKPFLERGKIERGGVPMRGGKYYEDAVEIKPGVYRLNHQLRQGEFDYFKVKLQGGQKLTISSQNTDLANYSEIALHSPERTRINGGGVYNANAMQSFSHELYDTSESDFYIVIGSGGTAVNEHAIYEIQIEDHFDGKSQSDAGNQFDSALPVSSGQYPNNWALSEDIDLYAIKMEKGATVSIKVVPEASDGGFTVSLLNQDRETVVTTSNKEPGSVTKLSSENPDVPQTFFIKVTRNPHNPGGKYQLHIETSPL